MSYHLEREMEWAAKQEAVEALRQALRYIPDRMFYSKNRILHAIKLIEGEQVPAKWGEE